MRFLFFIIFLVPTLLYIWNGKCLFTKKEWLSFFVKIMLVSVGGVVWALLVVLALRLFPGLDFETSRSLTAIIPASFMTILLCKFFVVMLCTIFKIILRFHQRHNTRENYSKIASLYTRYGLKLVIFTKFLASFGAVMMFYGIWLADAA